MCLGRDPFSFFVSFIVQKLRPSNSGIYLFLYYLFAIFIPIVFYSLILYFYFSDFGPPGCELVIFLSFLFYFFSLIFVILAEGFSLVSCPKISSKFFSFPKVFFFFLHITTIKLMNTSMTSHSSFVSVCVCVCMCVCVCVVRTLKICPFSKFKCPIQFY